MRHSIHAVRWVNALSERGHEVHLISKTEVGEALDARVAFHQLPKHSTAGYFVNVPPLKRLLRRLRPDILNAHYASGYGTLARLSGFQPTVLSVWGSDVYDFPLKSRVHAWLIRENLRRAAWVTSTSVAMAAKTQKIYPVDNISVVPFGIDISLFSPGTNHRHDDTITIGTVKTLAHKYGIDTLMQSFAALTKRLMQNQPELANRLRLVIIGGGPEEAQLRRLAGALGIAPATSFVGQVPHTEVPTYLNGLDIYVALSRFDSESFGVAVLEASACSLPVVVSNVGGLPEVVVDGRTGFVVPRESPGAAASALATLVSEASLRARFGGAGRLHVEQNYSWASSVDKMEEVYTQTRGYAP